MEDVDEFYDGLREVAAYAVDGERELQANARVRGYITPGALAALGTKGGWLVVNARPGHGFDEAVEIVGRVR